MYVWNLSNVRGFCIICHTKYYFPKINRKKISKMVYMFGAYTSILFGGTYTSFSKLIYFVQVSWPTFLISLFLVPHPSSMDQVIDCILPYRYILINYIFLFSFVCVVCPHAYTLNHGKNNNYFMHTTYLSFLL